MMRTGPLTRLWRLAAVAVVLMTGCGVNGRGASEFTVIVYGATPSGIAAAVAAARLGERVCLVAQGVHLGGMLTGGLSSLDAGDPDYIGGTSREVFHEIAAYYRNTYGEGSPQFAACRGGLCFEPHVAERVFEALVAKEKITVRRGWRLEAVREEFDRIKALVLDNPDLGVTGTLAGDFFIDASYTGDLLAEAGATFSTGREGRQTFSESLAGYLWQDPRTGRPLPGSTHARDSLVQAYGYRLCLTDSLENSAGWPEPENYDPEEYRILYDFIRGRGGVTAGDLMIFKPLPNRKFDIDDNPDCWLSTDLVGGSQGYPQGTYQERAQIEEAHLQYLLGLWKFLRSDPGLPASLRAEFDRFRPSADEFTDNGHLPYQIYVREARRLDGEYTFTERDATADTLKTESIGMGSQPLQSHATGPVRPPYRWREGCFSLPVRPYQIPYGILVPAWVRNLLVPVCVSASHVSYGALSFEPVSMILGQAAGTAASLCLEFNCEAHEAPMGELQKRLRENGAVLGPEQARPWRDEIESRGALPVK
ncbi:MAG: FAD-dependent oxidoreductase [Candidatus Glassbacteria bacterium]